MPAGYSDALDAASGVPRPMTSTESESTAGATSSEDVSKPAVDDAGAAAAPDLPVCIQFCSDMHLEMPLEIKRLGQHLQDCLRICDPTSQEEDARFGVVLARKV